MAYGLRGNVQRRPPQFEARYLEKKRKKEKAYAVGVAARSWGRVAFPRAHLGGGEEPGWNRPCSRDLSAPTVFESQRGAELPSHSCSDWFVSAGIASRLGVTTVSHFTRHWSQIVAQRRRRRRLSELAASYLLVRRLLSCAPNLPSISLLRGWKKAYQRDSRTIRDCQAFTSFLRSAPCLGCSREILSGSTCRLSSMEFMEIFHASHIPLSFPVLNSKILFLQMTS